MKKTVKFMVAFIMLFALIGTGVVSAAYADNGNVGIADNPVVREINDKPASYYGKEEGVKLEISCSLATVELKWEFQPSDATAKSNGVFKDDDNNADFEPSSDGRRKVVTISTNKNGDYIFTAKVPKDDDNFGEYVTDHEVNKIDYAPPVYREDLSVFYYNRDGELVYNAYVTDDNRYQDYCAKSGIHSIYIFGLNRNVKIEPTDTLEEIKKKSGYENFLVTEEPDRVLGKMYEFTAKKALGFYLYAIDRVGNGVAYKLFDYVSVPKYTLIVGSQTINIDSMLTEAEQLYIKCEGKYNAALLKALKDDMWNLRMVFQTTEPADNKPLPDADYELRKEGYLALNSVMSRVKAADTEVAVEIVNSDAFKGKISVNNAGAILADSGMLKGDEAKLTLIAGEFTDLKDYNAKVLRASGITGKRRVFRLKYSLTLNGAAKEPKVPIEFYTVMNDAPENVAVVHVDKNGAVTRLEHTGYGAWLQFKVNGGEGEIHVVVADGKGMPLWLIISLSVAGAILIAAGIACIIVKKKRKKAQNGKPTAEDAAADENSTAASTTVPTAAKDEKTADKKKEISTPPAVSNTAKKKARNNANKKKK